MKSNRSRNTTQNQPTLSCTSSIVWCLLKTRPFAHICAFSGIFEPVRRWMRENNSLHCVTRVIPSTYRYRSPYSMVTCITSDEQFQFINNKRKRGFIPDSLESFVKRHRLIAVSELSANPTEYFRSLKIHLTPLHTVGIAAYKCMKSKTSSKKSNWQTKIWT